MKSVKNMFFCLAGLCLAGSAIAGGTTSGSLDTSFGKRGAVVSSFSGAALNLNLQADGKSVASGLGNNLARYNTDGSLDSSFGSGGVVNTGYQTGSTIQTDGKIIVFGQDPVNISTAVIKRYNSNGTLDNTFGVNGVVVPNFGAGHGLGVVKQQSDGKILVGGVIVTNTFTYYDGWVMTTRTDVGGLLARFNANGSADTSFGNNGVVINYANSDATNNQIHGIAVQANGQIVTTGRNPTLARYNANGTLDTAFGTNGKVFDARFDDPSPSSSIPPYVAAGDVFIDSNGKITTALVRTWVTYNMNPILVRYNSDGSPDNSFGTVGAVKIGGEAVGTYLNGTYYTLSALAFQNEKIIISGAQITETYDSRHNSWATTRASVLGRYLSNGTIDTTFGTAGLVTTTINSNDFIVNDVAIQGDGKIVAAGMTDTDASSAVVNNFALARYNP